MSRRRLAIVSVALVVLGVGLVLGLRAGSSSTNTAATTASGLSATVTSATGAQTEPTEPSVTVATSTSTTSTTDLPGYQKPIVQLGDGNTPEQFILGALYYIALQKEGYEVTLTRNIGTPQIALAALHQGSLDLFPEYLNQWNSQLAGLTRRFSTLAAAYAAGSHYAVSHGAILLAPTPFSDTGGVVVTSQYAAANHIASLTDLAAGPGIVFAAPLEYVQSPQGLPVLERIYGLHPSYVQVVDFGSQYGWLESQDAQAAYASSTDPQLVGPRYQLLADPAKVFGYGNVVPVTTAHFVATEGPALMQTIERVDAALTTTAMRGLNYEVQVEGHDPTEVASEFLQGQGITPPVQFAPVPTTTSTTTTVTATETTATGTGPTATTSTAGDGG